MYAVADEICVWQSYHVRPVRVVHVADYMRRVKIPEQARFGCHIIRERRMLHAADVIHREIRVHAGVKRNALNPVCDQRLRGDLHDDMRDPVINHHSKVAVELAAFRRGVDCFKMLFSDHDPIGADIRAWDSTAA